MILRKFLVLAILCLVPSSASAGHLDLVWNSNSEPDLAGYRIYYGTASRDYTMWVDVGDVTWARITRLFDDTEYFLALTAYNIHGNESGFSAEVSTYAAPGDDPIGADDSPTT